MNEVEQSPNNSESVQEVPETVPKIDKNEIIMRDKEIFEEVLNDFIADFWEKAPKEYQKTGQNGTIRDKTGQNGTIRDKTGQNGTGDGTKRDKTGQNGTDSWRFSGSEIRAIFYFSSLTILEIAKEINLSDKTMSRYLKREVFPSEITKVIAAQLGLHTPQELREYYNDIPAEMKERYNRDCRIRRIAKPGLFIPRDVFKAAERLNRVGELSALAKARAEWI